MAELGALASESSSAADGLAKNLAEIGRFVEDNTQLEAVAARDYDGLEAKLRELARVWSWRWKGYQRTSFGSLSRNEVLERRDQVKADLDAFHRRERRRSRAIASRRAAGGSECLSGPESQSRSASILSIS